MTRKTIVFLVCISFAVLASGMMTSSSGAEEPTEPIYAGIADYYDNRKAVVTVTADDWYGSTTQSFEDMSAMLVGRHMHYTGAVMTSSSPDWNQIQRLLGQGYLEVASHSRTHSQVAYDSYDSEIGGSRQDIVGNLSLPTMFSFEGTEFVYSWIEPWGESDSLVRQKLGEYEYLTDRKVSIDDEWATWDSENGLFDPIGFSMRMERDYETDPNILNSKFDIVYNASGIYHLMTHPAKANWDPGAYADVHTAYISNRNDVWYVSFGLLYLYHWMDMPEAIQVTSTGSLQDKIFKANISPTDRLRYGAKYPVTYVFDIPPSWTDPHVNYRFRKTESWTPMEIKTSSDFFNGIDAVRFDSVNHKAYVSIGFDEASNEIYLKILPQSNQPTADFTASPTSGDAPLEVSFTDLSTSIDGITAWAWDFDNDGTVDDTAQDPIFVYEQGGLHNISLTVYDEDGDSDTETKINYISVNKPPVADANGPYTGTEGEPTTFNGSGSVDTDGVIITFAWDFGDGTSQIYVGSNLTAFATHTYAQNGLYPVTLTVTDDDTATDTYTTASIVADTNPTADFSATPTNGLELLTVSFNDNSTSHDGITSWDWDFGDGETSTEQNPIHTYGVGLYTVTLRVSEADGDSHTETKFPYIIVDDSVPTARFVCTPSNPPEGDPVTLNASDSAGYDQPLLYAWNFSDGTLLPNLTDPITTHTYTQDGNYVVKLTVMDSDGSTHSISQTVTVTDTAPLAGFIATLVSEPELLTVAFTDTSTSYDGIMAWAWDFDNDGVVDGTEQNITHQFPNSGTFNVMLMVTDADGSKANVTKPISILNTSPTADFNIASSPKPTVDEYLTLTDHSSDPDGIIVKWLWDLGDGVISMAQNVNHRYHALGTFIVNLTVTDNDGGTDTISKSITIYDVTPPVTIDDYDGLWRTFDFIVNLTATDDQSGVQTTYYIINDGPVMDVQTSGQPHISIERFTQLEYWSVDFYGNEETHHVIAVVQQNGTNHTLTTERTLVMVVAIGASVTGIIFWRAWASKTPTLRKERKS